MFEFLSSTLGVAAVGFYCYMGVVVGLASVKKGKTVKQAAWAGFTWPATMYWTMKNM